MKISGINYYDKSKYTTNSVNAVNAQNNTAPVLSDVTSSNYLHFTGWFKKKEKNNPPANNIEPFRGDEHGMSGNDYTISFKVADILHRLDDENILVIGSPKNALSKMAVQTLLIREDTELSYPKEIKNVYFVDNEASPLVIQKKNNNKFFVYGRACNLTNPNLPSSYNGGEPIFKYNYKNTAEYGDVLEAESGLKIKFLNLPKESNIPMYDAKFPIESFLTKGPLLEGGFVINNGISDKSGVSENVCEIKSDFEFGQNIPVRTFDDIAGMDDSIDFMKKKLLFPILYPNAFRDEKNHGIILYGPTGTGKTLLALATIGEVKKRQNKDVYFLKINSRDLEQQWVGVSEGRWRKVFEKLEQNQPSVLFIDEIDALMVDRDKVADSTNNHMTSQVAQLLQSIDNLEKTNAQVWIIGATNRVNAIDPAIKRSGRLGEIREVKRPNEEGCAQILDLYLKDKNVSKDFNRKQFAKECYKLEYTGSDIAQIVDNARLKMYERCGIIDKMDNGTYKDTCLNYIKYTQADFDAAIKTQEINKKAKQRIGFVK